MQKLLMEQHTFVINNTLHNTHMLQPYPKQEMYCIMFCHWHIGTHVPSAGRIYVYKTTNPPHWIVSCSVLTSYVSNQCLLSLDSIILCTGKLATNAGPLYQVTFSISHIKCQVATAVNTKHGNSINMYKYLYSESHSYTTKYLREKH
jgi:hypothetical protein